MSNFPNILNFLTTHTRRRSKSNHLLQSEMRFFIINFRTFSLLCPRCVLWRQQGWIRRCFNENISSLTLDFLLPWFYALNRALNPPTLVTESANIESNQIYIKNASFRLPSIFFDHHLKTISLCRQFPLILSFYVEETIGKVIIRRKSL